GVLGADRAALRGPVGRRGGLAGAVTVPVPVVSTLTCRDLQRDRVAGPRRTRAHRHDHTGLAAEILVVPHHTEALIRQLVVDALVLLALELVTVQVDVLSALGGRGSGPRGGGRGRRGNGGHRRAGRVDPGVHGVVVAVPPGEHEGEHAGADEQQ